MVFISHKFTQRDFILPAIASAPLPRATLATKLLKEEEKYTVLDWGSNTGPSTIKASAPLTELPEPLHCHQINRMENWYTCWTRILNPKLPSTKDRVYQLSPSYPDHYNTIPSGNAWIESPRTSKLPP